MPTLTLRMASAAALVTLSAAQACFAGAAKYEPLPIDVASQAASRTSVSISPDGLWVSYADRNDNTLHAVQLATGRDVKLAGDPGLAGWSPDSRHLAYVAGQRDRATLSIWDRDTGVSRPIEATGGKVVSWYHPAWFADSEHLTVGLIVGDTAPEEAVAEPGSSTFWRPAFQSSGPGGASVFVLRARLRPPIAGIDDAAAASGEPNRTELNWDERRKRLGLVDIRSGSMRTLASDAGFASSFWPAPNGKSVAYYTVTGQDANDTFALYSLRVLDLATGTARLVAKNLRCKWPTGSWSPDSTQIAVSVYSKRPTDVGDVTRHAAGDIVLIDVAKATTTTLVAQDGLPFFDLNKHAMWTTNSRAVYAVSAAGELWELSARKSRRVGGVPGYRIDEIVAGTDVWDGNAVAPASGWIPVLVKSVDGRQQGIYEMSLTGGEPRLRATDFINVKEAVASRAAGMVAIVAENVKTPATTWLLHADRDRLEPLDANASLARFALGDVRLIQWRTAEGTELNGALLLPPGYAPGQRLPLVVVPYGGDMNSRRMNTFGLGGSGLQNFQILATRGYAVLYPDIPIREGRAMADIVAAVLPGVDAAIAQGFADPERLALFGYSMGSYSALALLTQSTRFKAAIIGGVIHPDVTAWYLWMQPDGTSGQNRAAEKSQLALGGSLWEYPDRFRENSPIYGFDRIQTPILIAQGEVDLTTPISGANAVFVALRRLGKPVEYRIYEGERHTWRRRPNIIDFWNRSLEFLPENLDIATDEQHRVILDGDRARSRGSLSPDCLKRPRPARCRDLRSPTPATMSRR